MSSPGPTPMPQLLKELDLPCLLSVSLWRWKKPICGLGRGFKCHRFENMNTGRKEPWVIYCNTRSGERQFYNIQTKSGRLPSIHTLLLIEPRFCSGMSMCVTHNRSIHTHTHTHTHRERERYMQSPWTSGNYNSTLPPGFRLGWYKGNPIPLVWLVQERMHDPH